jgi:hypothetical protein
MSAAALTRVAAVLLWFAALGFGLPCLAAIRNLLTGRDLPLIMGFRAYGGGPFERAGIHTTVALLVAFLLVGILEGVAGWLLWGDRKAGTDAGAILALALFPVGAVFWWGFALPIPPILAVVRTILILLSWRGLK